MKSALISLVLFYGILQFSVYVEAAVSRSSPHPSRRPGGCYSDRIGHFNASETVTVPGVCKSARCASSGVIIYHSCGVRSPGPGCNLSPPDLSKPYNDCCPKVIC